MTDKIAAFQSFMPTDQHCNRQGLRAGRRILEARFSLLCRLTSIATASQVVQSSRFLSPSCLQTSQTLFCFQVQQVCVNPNPLPLLPLRPPLSLLPLPPLLSSQRVSPRLVSAPKTTLACGETRQEYFPSHSLHGRQCAHTLCT